MKQLIAIGILLMLTITTFSQERDIPLMLNYDALRNYAVIQSVEFTPNGETADVRVTYQPTGCEPLQVEQVRVGDPELIYLIDLFSPKSELDQRCRLASTAEVIFTIDTDIDANYVLNINGSYYNVFPQAPDITVMDSGAQLVSVGETAVLEPYWVEPMIITDVSLVDSQILGLNLIGGTNGCIGDIFQYSKQNLIEPNLLHVEAFRLHPQTMDCPENFVDTFATIVLPNEKDSQFNFMLNRSHYQYNAGTITRIVRQPIIIEDVVIAPSPNGFDVTVRGTQQGDCNQPITVLQASAAYGSSISIHVDVPEVTPCTRNLIPYENTLTTATLPVIINGTVYGREDRASSRNENEENMFRSPTIIESVQVNVLESFPMQLQLEVTGYLPDGCNFPIEVEQSVDGNTVNVQIYRMMPNIPCPAVIVPYNETITIEGSFTGGTVTITVNNITTSVDL